MSLFTFWAVIIQIYSCWRWQIGSTTDYDISVAYNLSCNRVDNQFAAIILTCSGDVYSTQQSAPDINRIIALLLQS